VRLTKEPGGETLLLGKITPVPRRGFVEQFARSFDITGGELQLNGRPADHRVDLHAEYRPPSADRSNDDDVKIKLDVTGPFDKLELALTSEPAMDETEIVNYIATGRSNVPGVGDPNAKDDTGSLATDIGIAGLTGGAQMAAQEAIGLDVLQVRFDALDGATLVAGRYVDPKVYVGFLQPLQYKDEGSPTSNALARTRFEVEYAFQRWLVLNVKGESTELRSFLRVRHEY
jgi:autotransporter translocation and assembly factor TamB